MRIGSFATLAAMLRASFRPEQLGGLIAALSNLALSRAFTVNRLRGPANSGGRNEDCLSDCPYRGCGDSRQHSDHHE
jgi:hypothetical protein